jgi:hypothetical protein
MQSSAPMNEFRKFLNQFKCEKGQPFTHMSMGKGGGAGFYFIPRVRHDEFFEQYTRELVRPGALLHLTELPTDPSPMRTDLDFRFTLPADGVIARCYTRADIERIVACYCTVIAEYVQVMPDTPIVAYVLEKPDATEYRGKMKDGVHIIWPSVVVSHNVHHLIRKRVLDMASEIFHGMSICNDYSDIIDDAIIDENNWQMYGSRKPDSGAYQVTAIYEWVPTLLSTPATGVLRELAKPTVTEEPAFVELFSMRHKDHYVSIICSEKISEINEYIRNVLPATDELRRARQDNQIRFKEIFTLVDRCAGSDGAHFDVAKVVHAMFKDRYRYAKNGMWYVYVDHKHRWLSTTGGAKLREVLSTDVFSKFVERALYWTQEGARSLGNREHFEERSKKMLNISNRLKSLGYKNSVMKECQYIFTDEEFYERLDRKQHLQCFENGVYDSNTQEFRDGLPDDYLTVCTNTYYIPCAQ